ncbi:MAG: ATPase [Planctomycetaceae bacterium]|nr:ATPase [Planctomycetaceae bacterium]
MRRQGWPRYIVALLITGMVSAGSVIAEEKTVYTAEEVSTLLKRLEESENRISEFEEKLNRIEENQLKLEANDQNIVEFISAEEPTPVPGADEHEAGGSFDELLAETEKRWEEQLKVNKDLEKAIKGSVQPGGKDVTMKLSGRIHADYWAFPGDSPGTNAFETGDSTNDPDDRIGFRRLRFGVGGNIWENMGYKIEMEFAGGNDVEFRDAYLSFKHLPFFQDVVIGNQKRPYGLDHLNSSRYNVFMERPFIIESFNQDARRLGIQSYGVSDDQAYNWRFGVFNARLVQDEGLYISDHYQSEIAGRLAHTWWYDECSDGRGYAHFGIAGTAVHPDGSTGGDAPNNLGRDQNEARFRHRPEARSTNRWLDTGRIAGAQWYELLGLESVVNVGPTQLVGEYQYMWLQNEAGINPDMNFHGGYVYLSYFLTGEHIPWDRESGTLGRVKPFENFFLVDRCSGGTGGGWGAWQVAVRYSYADLTDETVFGGVGESITFGLNWHWNPHARMQFNYIYGEITDRNVTDVNALTFTGGDYHIIGTRFMVDF